MFEGVIEEVATAVGETVPTPLSIEAAVALVQEDVSTAVSPAFMEIGFAVSVAVGALVLTVTLFEQYAPAVPGPVAAPPEVYVAIAVW